MKPFIVLEIVNQGHPQCNRSLDCLDLIREQKKGYTYFQRNIAEITLKVVHKVTTLQTLLRGTQHAKCYSYHARSSVTVSGGGRNATVHDPQPYT